MLLGTGSAVLLPLRPPNYEPRVLIAGGTSQGANWSATEVDLGTTRGVYGLAARLNVSLPGMERQGQGYKISMSFNMHSGKLFSFPQPSLPSPLGTGSCGGSL